MLSAGALSGAATFRTCQGGYVSFRPSTAPLGVAVPYPRAADFRPGEDVRGEMLAPSLFNNNLVRLAATAAVIVATAKASGHLPAQALSFLHLAAYGTWLGAIIWTTFIAGAKWAGS